MTHSARRALGTLLAGIFTFSAASLVGPTDVAIADNGVDVPLYGDNVHTYSGGGVNVRALDLCETATCTHKSGDTVHVAWEVQAGALLQSSNHIQTSNDLYMFVPKAVENLQLSYVYVPEVYVNESLWGNPDAPRTFVPHGQPIELFTSYEDYSQRVNEYGSEFYVLSYAAYTGPLTNVDSYGSVIVDHSGSEVSVNSSDSKEQYVGVAMTIPANSPVTIRVEGDITLTDSTTDVFVPMRATNIGWRCFNEDFLPGSYENGCQSLLEYAPARKGPLPDFSLTDKAINAEHAKNNSIHGLLGSNQCAVTEELYRYDRIGRDIRSATSISDWYTLMFRLHDNPAINYLTNGFNEDGCDQAAVQLSIDNSVEPPVDPTDPPTDPTEPPVEPTEPPVEPTEPPVDPTEPPTEPVEPTEPPTEPTEPPADPTAPPVAPTDPPNHNGDGTPADESDVPGSPNAPHGSSSYEGDGWTAHVATNGSRQPSSSLPYTGAQVASIAGLGALLLTGGIATLVMARKKKRS